MSSANPRVSPHPAPQHRQSLFTVFGGPLAWFLQLNADFALASNPCFVDNKRVAHLASDWTWHAMIAIAMATFIAALAATLIAWRAHRAAREQRSGDSNIEMDTGRVRFLAMWGVCLGAGSALLIVLTALAFFVLPRCAG